MVELKPAQSMTLQDSAHEQLLDAIITGKIAPGEKVTLAEIAGQLGVSSQPVREALRPLEAQGFVSIERNRRIIVTKYSAEELRGLLEIRLILEGYAAEKGTQNFSDEDLGRLEGFHKGMIEAESGETYLKANADFHFTLYRLADNKQLIEIIEMLWRRLSPYLSVLTRGPAFNDREIFHETHRSMIEACRQRDGGLVRVWLEEDLTRAARYLLGVMQEEDESSE